MGHMHDGHRNRLRERIRATGLAGLAPHEVLEYFLFAVIPRRDTNRIAHNLLARYGSLSGVLDADYADLLTVEGITPNAALFLSELASLTVLYKTSKAKTSGQPLTSEAAVGYVNDLIGYSPEERFAALVIDTKGNLTRTLTFESDKSDAVGLSVRNLIKELLVSRAVAVIVAHNHPSGDVRPSAADVSSYRQLARALQAVDIKLLDCLIVSEGNAYSMAFDSADAAGTSLRFAEEENPSPVACGKELDAGTPVQMGYDLLYNRDKDEK